MKNFKIGKKYDLQNGFAKFNDAKLIDIIEYSYGVIEYEFESTDGESIVIDGSKIRPYHKSFDPANDLKAWVFIEKP